MGIPAPLADFSRGARALAQTFSRAFPRPEILLPPAAGLDLSDASLKWIVLREGSSGKEVRAFGREDLPAGAVVNGVIENIPALAEVLRALKETMGVECIHAALPEESAYVFSMHVPNLTSREQVRSLIEFELQDRVPIGPSDAIYDYDVITERDGDGEIGVTVFPREHAERYASVFEAAGLTLLSLEVEASSIARAVSSRDEREPITLVVDFGELRTGLAVLKRGIPIFTSTIAVGGGSIDRALAKLGLAPEAALKFKNEEGLLAREGKDSALLEVALGTASALADEVVRHFHYWDTRRNERGDKLTPLGQVFLLGGSGNLKGLADYLASRVQVEAVRPTVWRHVCSFDEYIPPIERRVSLGYVTAIGLALRGS
ncbi:pilus assembly protein PilM [Candidatus Kaiserbacteria bacterium]|nr:pilus assembly protein PilM [Candidatus Kaiserbacteria bacterium]